MQSSAHESVDDFESKMHQLSIVCLFVFFPNFQFFLPFLMSVRKFGFFLIVLFLKIYDILNCIYQRQYFIIYYHDVIYCQTSSADKEEKMQICYIYELCITNLMQPAKKPNQSSFSARCLLQK